MREDRPCVVIVVGASGAPEYAAQFRQSADRWQAAAKKAGAESIRIGLSDQAGVTDRERLKSILAETGQGRAGAALDRADRTWHLSMDARPSSTCADRT